MAESGNFFKVSRKGYDVAAVDAFVAAKAQEEAERTDLIAELESRVGKLNSQIEVLGQEATKGSEAEAELDQLRTANQEQQGRIAELEAQVAVVHQQEEALRLTLASATRTRDEMLAAAEEEITRSRAQVDEETERMLAEANARLAESNAESERLTASARAEADRITAEAAAEADRIRSAATEEAGGIVARAHEAAASEEAEHSEKMAEFAQQQRTERKRLEALQHAYSGLADRLQQILTGGVESLTAGANDVAAALDTIPPPPPAEIPVPVPPQPAAHAPVMPHDAGSHTPEVHSDVPVAPAAGPEAGTAGESVPVAPRSTLHPESVVHHPQEATDAGPAEQPGGEHEPEASSEPQTADEDASVAAAVGVDPMVDEPPTVPQHEAGPSVDVEIPVFHGGRALGFDEAATQVTAPIDQDGATAPDVSIPVVLDAASAPAQDTPHAPVQADESAELQEAAEPHTDDMPADTGPTEVAAEAVEPETTQPIETEAHAVAEIDTTAHDAGVAASAEAAEGDEGDEGDEPDSAAGARPEASDRNGDTDLDGEFWNPTDDQDTRGSFYSRRSGRLPRLGADASRDALSAALGMRIGHDDD